MQTNKLQFLPNFSILTRKLRQFKHGSFSVDLLIIIENTILNWILTKNMYTPINQYIERLENISFDVDKLNEAVSELIKIRPLKILNKTRHA